MTEDEWLATDNPLRMLAYIRFASDQPRKFALFGIAAYRIIWNSLDEKTRRYVEAAEEIEKTDCDTIEVENIFSRNLQRQEVGMFGLRDIQDSNCSAEACHCVRDIFGNPFRSFSVDRQYITADAVAIAKFIYQYSEFNQMPILADALQDGMCDNEILLYHCRFAAGHIRGCWVIDSILGYDE